MRFRFPLWYLASVVLAMPGAPCEGAGFNSPHTAAPSVRVPSDIPALTSAYNCVSLTKGSYFINDGGLSVDGPVPLEYSYCYDSDILDEDYHLRAWGWSVGLPWRFGYLRQTDKREWSVMGEEKEGFMVSFVGSETKKASSIPFSVNPSVYAKGYTNLSGGFLSGQTFLGNHKVSYQNWSKNYEWGSFEVISGSGSRRVYEHFYFNGMPQWRLLKEIKPNGHVVHYSYLDAHTFKRIWTTDASNHLTFNSIEFTYDSNGYTMTAQNGQSVRYNIEPQYLKRKDQKGYIPHLKEIIRTDGPTTKHVLAGDGAECNWLQNTRREWPDGRYMNIVRQGKKTNVVALEMPAGSDASPVRIASFSYHPSYAEVRDAYSIKTTYRFSSDARIAAIEKYSQEDLLAFSHLFFWKGPLLSATALSAQGGCLNATCYSYDDAANVLQETFYGNLTGQGTERFDLDLSTTPQGELERDTTSYTYTKDGFNLRASERHSNGLIIEYDYQPSTNLIKAKLTGDGNTIYSREFYTYDSHSLLIEIIKDDGTRRQREDTHGATTRLVTRITPRLEAPAVGFTAEMVESYCDLQTGIEHQLKRSVYHYNQLDQLIQEDLYDAENTFRYALHYTYDEKRNLVSQTDAGGRLLRMSYDDNKNKTSEELVGSGFKKVFSYDFCNRLIKEEEIYDDGLVLETTYRYNYLGEKTAMIDPYGQETLYEYDALGHLIKTTLPPVLDENGQLIGAIVRQEYDVQGNCVAVTDPLGNRTVKRYNARSQPTYICYPDGTSERTLYTLDGKVSQVTDKNGMTTRFAYDILGRTLSKECYSSTGEWLTGTTAVYQGSHLIAETDGNGSLTEYFYDGAGRQSAMVKGDSITTIEYDSLGRKSKVIENGQRATCYEYDLLDHVTEERVEDTEGTLLRLVNNSYDLMGNVVATTTYSDAGPATTVTRYNAQGKPIQITDAVGHSSHIQYNHFYRNKSGQQVLEIMADDPLGQQMITTHDAMGRVVSVTKRNAFQDLSYHEISYDLVGHPIRRKDVIKNPGGADRILLTTWTYNSMGQLLRLVEAEKTPDEKRTCYRYNLQGQQEAIIYSDGLEVLSYYDALGRLSHHYASDKSFSYVYRYDANNNVTAVESATGGTTLRVYDHQNRMIEETLENGLKLSYRYDPFGRLSHLGLPDGSGVQYIYDALFLRQVQRITPNGDPSYAHHYLTYDLTGHCTQAQLATGQIETYVWDKMGRPLAFQSAPYSQTDMEYDAVGNLLGKNVIDAAGPSTCRYQYDPLYQLRSENGMKDHQYCHDSLFNRTSKDTIPYTVNALNQLLQQGTSCYKYDSRGYLVSRETHESVQTYLYDGLGRLTAVETATGTITYSYDAFNRRLSKVDQGLTTRFLYGGQNEIGTVDNEGHITQLRVLGKGLGAEIGAAISMELEGQIYVPQQDHNGNVTTLLDLAGHVVETYRYSAFGEETLYAYCLPPAPRTWWTWNAPSPVPILQEVARSINPWRFSSKRVDEETGWIYFGRRHYDPEVGRWITPDPLGFTAGPNLYAYVSNSPLTHFDLYGLLEQSRRTRSQDSTKDRPIRQQRRGVDLFRLPGRIMEKITHYLAPPVLRDWLKPVCRLTSFRPPGGCEYCHDYSAYSYVVDGPQKTNLRMLAVNGQENMSYEGEAFGKFIASTHNYRTKGIYNSTFGLLYDTLHSIGMKMGVCKDSIHVLRSEILKAYEEIKDMPDPTIFLNAFSQGAEVAWRASRSLPPEVRQCIVYQSWGPSTLIPKGWFRSTTNTVATNDYVSITACGLDPIKGFSRSNADVTWIEGKGFVSHPWESAYSDNIKDRGLAFQRKYLE